MGAARKHGRTRARIDNTKRLVAALAEGEMPRPDIGELLGLSLSGIRKYVTDLIEHDVAYVVSRIGERPGCMGVPVYALNPDQGKVESFLAALAVGQLNQPSGGRPTLLSTALADPSRHFHVLKDDDVISPRVSRTRIPAHEPLHAAFFGLAGAQGEVHA